MRGFAADPCPLAGSRDAAGKLVVVGDVIANGLEATDLFETGSAEDECGTEAELLDADHGGDKRGGDEIRGDAERLPPAREARRDGAIDAGDKSDALIFERCDNTLQVAVGHKDVTVIH